MARPFSVIGEEQVAPVTAPVPEVETSEDAQKALQILALALRVVGQRTIIALSNLFTAGAVFSAWLLWYRILPNPNTYQIIGISLYSGLLLAVEWVRRKK